MLHNLQLVIDRQVSSSKQKRLPEYLVKIAQLGGYLARGGDPPPDVHGRPHIVRPSFGSGGTDSIAPYIRTFDASSARCP